MTPLGRDEEKRSQVDGVRTSGIFDGVRWIAVYGTLLYIFFLGAYLIVRAFQLGLYPGIRSSASALLPLIVASFLFIFRRQVLEQLGKVPSMMAFLLSLVIGVLVMVVVRLFAHSSTIPIAELVLSGCFSILVFSSGSLKEDEALSYYYGVVSGFLLYIILLGFPLLN